MVDIGGHARALLSLQGEQQKFFFLKKKGPGTIVSGKGLNVREYLNSLVRSVCLEPAKPKRI